MACLHEAIVAAIVAISIATSIATWLLELNIFNSSNRGGDSRSPVGRHMVATSIAATIASCIHYVMPQLMNSCQRIQKS